LASCLALISTARADLPGGIGVLGDSYSDEYQFSSPDRQTARNWVEILVRTRGLDFGRLNASGSGWGEPRNRGFEYNWARSDSTTEGLVAAGQHTGLAAQDGRGHVRLVFVFVGGNDFIDAMKSHDPEAALETTLPRTQASYQVAVRTILDASPDVRLVLVTVPDIRLLPEFAGPIREGRLPVRLADACSAAMGHFNAQIRALAGGDPRIGLIDFALVSQVADLLSHDYAIVAGRKLDRRRPGNSPDRFFLADGRHPGTLAQSQMSRMFIDAVNAQFEAGIEPLRDSEVLALADHPPHDAAGRDGILPEGREPRPPAPEGPWPTSSYNLDEGLSPLGREQRPPLWARFAPRMSIRPRCGTN
jgi:phospholipase/lecithinase/hemolysin